jgi:hypothetical protein
MTAEEVAEAIRLYEEALGLAGAELRPPRKRST